MPSQTDIQQLIQSMTPSGVNNGNPNTAWNQPRQTTPPPMLGADGQWFLNSVNPAASLPGTQLSHTAWQAPANSLQANLPDWRRPLIPQAGPIAPAQPAPPASGGVPPITQVPSPVVNEPPLGPLGNDYTGPGDGTWAAVDRTGRNDPSLRWGEQPMIAQLPPSPNDMGYLWRDTVQYPDRNQQATQQDGGGWDGRLADPVYTGEAPSTFGSTVNSPNPFNTSGLPAADWFNEQSMYGQSLNIPNIAPAPPPPPLPNDGNIDGGGFWDKAANFIDDKIFGDMFNQDTNKMNWGNVGFGMLEAVTGIPFNNGRMSMGTNNLMTSGTGASADYARNQLARSYMSAPPENRTQMINELSKKYSIPPEQVLARIGVQ